MTESFSPQSARFEGDPEALREWQRRMGFTFDQAHRALGIGRTTFAKMLRKETRIDLCTALACAAIEAGIAPLRQAKQHQFNKPSIQKRGEINR